MPADVSDRLIELLAALGHEGPRLARPFADTLKGSRYANMKELRLTLADDWYRFAFAFDPRRRAVVLCGGGKGGMSQDRFYRTLIARADARFGKWLKENT